jgi:hypothetical protein
MLLNLARVCGCSWMLAVGLAFASGACVSPDTFNRDGSVDEGTGGTVGGGTGGTSGPGSGGAPGAAGSNGTGGHVGGAGGTTTTVGVGGHTGFGGSIVGPTANFMEDFESPGIADRWFWDSDTGSMLNPSSTSCGQWAVATDGATTNHMFSQSEACSGPSWAAAGNSGWTDMRLQARVMFPPGSTTSSPRIMIGVRFASDRDQIYIEYTMDGKLKIRQKIAAGGAPSDTSNTTKVAVPVGQWVTVGLSVSGSTINAYLGDDRTAPPVITATAVGLPAGGIAIGTTAGTASFDDVLVTPP